MHSPSEKAEILRTGVAVIRNTVVAAVKEAPHVKDGRKTIRNQLIASHNQRQTHQILWKSRQIPLRRPQKNGHRTETDAVTKGTAKMAPEGNKAHRQLPLKATQPQQTSQKPNPE